MDLEIFIKRFLPLIYRDFLLSFKIVYWQCGFSFFFSFFFFFFLNSTTKSHDPNHWIYSEDHARLWVQVLAVGSLLILRYLQKSTNIYIYLFKTMAPKCKIQTINFLCNAKHNYDVQFQYLNPHGSWDIYRKISTIILKMSISIIFSM